jgi:hypothetical protein
MATTTLCSTSFLSAVNSLPETPAIYRSSRAKPIAVFGGSRRNKVRGNRQNTKAKFMRAHGIGVKLRRESDQVLGTDAGGLMPTSLPWYQKFDLWEPREFHGASLAADFLTQSLAPPCAGAPEGVGCYRVLDAGGADIAPKGQYRGAARDLRSGLVQLA